MSSFSIMTSPRLMPIRSTMVGWNAFSSGIEAPERCTEPALKHMVNAVDGPDFSPESRFALFGLRLLFLVRLDDCLRRTFWRGLHARRGLTLWACSRSAARLSVDR